jgi:hypothetical protein
MSSGHCEFMRFVKRLWKKNVVLWFGKSGCQQLCNQDNDNSWMPLVMLNCRISVNL